MYDFYFEKKMNGKVLFSGIGLGIMFFCVDIQKF